MNKWKVLRSRLSGYWYALPPGFGLTTSENAAFPTWDKAFDFAFWEATRSRQFHEVP